MTKTLARLSYISLIGVIFSVIGLSGGFPMKLASRVNAASNLPGTPMAVSPFLTDIAQQVADHQRAILSLSQSNDDEMSLFQSLDRLRGTGHRHDPKILDPLMKATALIDVNGHWLAWTGTPFEIDPEWLNLIAESESDASAVYLLETPISLCTIHLQRLGDRIAVVQLTFLEWNPDDIHTGTIRIASNPVIIQLTYHTPFQFLPGVMYLENGLTDPLLDTLFTPLEMTDHPVEKLRNWRLIRLAEAVSLPGFFAGDFIGIHSALTISLIGLAFWFLTSFLIIRPSGRIKRLLTGTGCLIAILAAVHYLPRLATTLIYDTGSAWWPDFIGEYGYLSLILPLSTLLVSGALIRIILWSAATALKNPDPSKGKKAGHGIPGWVCQALAVICLSPLLIIRSDSVARETISTRLQNWVINRTDLVPLALETNLRILAVSATEFLSTGQLKPEFPALELWRRSDLHALRTDFGIQLLQNDGRILDQFSPRFSLQPIHEDALLQTDSSKDGRLIIPSKLQRGVLRACTTGLAAIRSDDQTIGFLVVQIPSGPESIIPLPGQWGDNVQLFIARGGSSTDWPTDCPVDYPFDWIVTTSDSQRWMTDPEKRFHVLLYQLPDSGTPLPEFVICLLPVQSLIAHLAGVARLILMALMILIPGLLYLEIRRIIRIRVQKSYGSFTRQLLGAFLLPVIILPIAFAASVHRLIQDTSVEYQALQLRNLYQQNMVHIREKIITEATRILADIEQQLICTGEIIDHAGCPWTVLDEYGRPMMTGTQPPVSDLPLASVSKIYQEKHTGNITNSAVVYQSSTPGELTAQIVIPFPYSRHYNDDMQFSGTFICELPITGTLIRSVLDPADATLDIYSRDFIVASNRPELFNTDVLPIRMRSNLYRRMFLNEQDSIIEINRNRNYFSITQSILSDSGNPVAAVVLTSSHPPFTPVPVEPQEWFLLATAFLIISGIVFSLFFGRRIAKPVQDLTIGARQLSAGDFTIRVPEIGVGETRLLTRTFNTMIDDLQRQRRDLQERHAFISTVLASMSSAILAVDDADHVLAVNKAFRSFFELGDSDLVDTTVTDLLKQIDCPELIDAYREQDFTDSSDQRIIRLFKEGRIIHLALRFVGLESSEGKTGHLTILDDVTGTIQSSKLQAYADLARRIAHEIKNPLTPIQLSIEHMRQAWDDRVPDFQNVFNQCISMVLEEVQSLEHISSEFSRFARFPKPVFRIADIRDLIHDIGMLYPAPPDGINLKLEMSSDELLCRFDHDQMKRVIINLVQNAFHAMGTGGDLTVRAFGDDRWIILEVKDTGHGMDRDTLLHLFEPYFSTKREGTGLGLVITRAVIEAHDGDIQVSSTPGTGTCFTIRLTRVKKGDLTSDDPVFAGED
ncbi:HAMP domain-containing protein [bacterium]|nr:HAMP domain-containing protein [candidate division CSSED10-310 bacterium]